MNDLLKEIQSIQINMLKEFIRVCEKHELRYFLLGGSALGAVRHRGFIPWDDDIDVGMPRSDYEKFLSIAQDELPENMFLQYYKTEINCPFLFSKIRDENTTFIENSICNIIMSHGIYIDIFPLDGYSKTYFINKLKRFIYNVFSSAVFRKSVGVLHFSSRNFKSKSIDFLINILSVLFTKKLLIFTVESAMRQYDYDLCEIVVNWNGAWGEREVVRKSVFDKGLRVKFEDIFVMIPYDYNLYLKSLYGDYMTLPPPEKRVSHHHSKKIDLKNSYKKYLGK